MMIRYIQRQHSGFVIVVVLSMIMMLVIFLLCFNRQSYNDLLAAQTLRETCQAYNCARSALNISIAAIRNNSDFDADKTLAGIFSGKKTFDIDSCRCSVEVVDENGKINLNKLIDDQGKPSKNTIEQLLRLIDVLNKQSGSKIDYSIVPAIVDWIDSDEIVSFAAPFKGENSGAESAYYMQLTPPYKCPNMPLDAVDEILLVKGVSPETFERIQNYVTVYGDGKININSAPKEVIESLSDKMDSPLAQAIIDKRQYKLFETVAELRGFLWMTESMYNEIRDKLTTTPLEKYYNITACSDNFEDCKINVTVKLDTSAKKIDIVRYTELNRAPGKSYEKGKNG